MTFYWPNAFWLLLLPVGFAVAELTRRVRAAASPHPKIMQAEASPSGLRFLGGGGAPVGPHVRWRLWLGCMLAITAAARPQWGEIEEPVFEQSREILIAVDLSRSMLATDVSPTRLDRSKLLITSLLERLAGERVGLIVFAGTSFLQCPLSADYEILREFLPSLNPDYLPQGGTDYAALLDTALDAFSDDSGADRFLIVLSDGESQTEAWQERTETLRKRGIRVIALGVGTADGSMLPDGKGGFVKDERGAVVLSRLNLTTLEDLARRTGGVYRDASTWVDLAELLRQTVEAGRQGDFSEKRRARKIERFQWALAPALFCFLLSLWREFPVQPRQRAITIRPSRDRPATARGVIPVLLCGLVLLGAPRSEAADLVPPTQGALPAVPGPTRSPAGLPMPRPSPAPSPAAPEPPALEAPLNTLIGRLAAQPGVSASEYAELANQTLTYGQRVLGSGQKPTVGAIYDALDGVDAGEAADAKAADWPTLREALRKLLEQAQPPPQDKQQQDQKDKQDQQDQKDQQQDQGNQGKDGDKGDQGDQKQDGKDGQKGDQDGKSGDQGQNGQNGDQPKPGESGDQKPDQQNQGGGGQDSSTDKSQQPKPQDAQSAFGDKDQKPEGQPDKQPQPAPPREQPGTQSIGGQPTQSAETSDNPALAVPLQKLDQLKQQDSPAQLYQLMQDPTAQPATKGRDW